VFAALDDTPASPTITPETSASPTRLREGTTSVTDHPCTPPAAAEDGQPWRCPDCGQLWEPLPQQPADHVEPAEPVDYESETKMSKSNWALVALVAAVPLATYSGSPVLIGVLCVIGLMGAAYWFWNFFRS
jgi:hypothetical protein